MKNRWENGKNRKVFILELKKKKRYEVLERKMNQDIIWNRKLFLKEMGKDRWWKVGKLKQNKILICRTQRETSGNDDVQYAQNEYF